MSDYTNYDCPCGRKHDVGIECAIGKRMRLNATAIRITDVGLALAPMKTPIHKIKTGEEPKYPCWLFLPECSEWQWYETPMPANYTRTVMSHWSPGGRPEAPRDWPNVKNSDRADEDGRP